MVVYMLNYSCDARPDALACYDRDNYCPMGSYSLVTDRPSLFFPVSHGGGDTRTLVCNYMFALSSKLKHPWGQLRLNMEYRVHSSILHVGAERTASFGLP